MKDLGLILVGMGLGVVFFALTLTYLRVLRELARLDRFRIASIKFDWELVKVQPIEHRPVLREHVLKMAEDGRQPIEDLADWAP